MALQLERKADFHIVLFGEELNIFTAKDDFEALQGLTQEALSQLMFDLSQVADFDSAGLQLLLWAHQQLQPEQPAHWIGVDNPVIDRVLQLFQMSWPPALEHSSVSVEGE